MTFFNMSAYLLYKKEIRFKQTKSTTIDVNQNTNVKLPESRWAQVEVKIEKEDIRAFAEDKPTSQNGRVFSIVKQLVELETTDDQKKTVSISFKNDLKVQVQPLIVDIEIELLKDIVKTLGNNVRLRLEILEAKTSNAPPSLLPKPENSGGFAFSIPDRATIFNSTSAPNPVKTPTSFIPSFGNVTSKTAVPTVDLLRTVGPICYTSEMPVNQTEDSSRMKCNGLIAFPTKWSPHWIAPYSSEIEFTASVNLIISITHFHELNSEKFMSIFFLNKKLLEDKIQTDMEIVAKNGKTIECHSAFLASQSEVLKSAIENVKKEGRNKITLLADVTEDGINNLLAYLYYRDVDNPSKFCSASVELLQVGHKYLITSLVDDMKKILLEKPWSWFDTDWTLQLFFFSNALPVHADLKEKAVGVLKMNPSNVTASKEYKRLFKGNDVDSTCTATNESDPGEQLQLAKELCTALLFSTKPIQSSERSNIKPMRRFPIDAAEKGKKSF